MPELVLKLGDNVVQTYVFDKDMMGIGRSRDNDIVIENLSVSRNHCRIRQQGGKFVLTDLNSANGTYVNGVKITKTEIVDGDQISVGKHKLLFQNPVVSEEQIVSDALGQDRTMLVDRAPQPVLVVTDGKLKGTEFLLTKFETSVGKSQENDIVIGDDWFLSKKQAVIYKRGAEFEIHDFGGFRKTKVNGQPLNEARMLKPGDVVELGNTRCVFQLAGETAPTGRVPQEMAAEDSIFSSGMNFADSAGAAQVPPPATERDEPSEAYLVEGLPEEPVALAGSAAAASSHPETAPETAAAADPPQEPAKAAEDPAGSSSPGPRRRKRERLRELAGAAAQQANGQNTGSVYGVVPPPPAAAAEASEAPPLSPETDGEAENPLATGVPEAPASTAPEQEAEELQGSSFAEGEAPTGTSCPGNWTGGMSDAELAENAELQREVALWERALQNKSAVIRRQAAKTLKKLTGRDYEI